MPQGTQQTAVNFKGNSDTCWNHANYNLRQFRFSRLWLEINIEDLFKGFRAYKMETQVENNPGCPSEEKMKSKSSHSARS